MKEVKEMEQQDYMPNSDKYKKAQQDAAEEKHFEKVTSGRVKVKKTGWQKFKEIFLPDSPDNIANYIMTAVVIPKVKDIILDSVDSFLNGGVTRSHSNRKSAYVDYNGRSTLSQGKTIVNESNVDSSRKIRAIASPYILYDTKSDAIDVLEKMNDALGEYGIVTIADMDDIAGVTGDYTDNNYGWYDLRGAKVVQTRDGFTIDLPKANPINRDD